jgi:hypothetical protein
VFVDEPEGDVEQFEDFPGLVGSHCFEAAPLRALRFDPLLLGGQGLLGNESLVVKLDELLLFA